MSEHPWDDTQADVIFCASDGVKFRVHKLVLSLASDFFRDMFRLPQNGNDSLPEIPCSEPSTILDNLFRLCYPIQDPSIPAIQDVRATLVAAMKYDMKEAIYLMRQELSRHTLTSPMRVYAIACCLDLEDEAHCAAKTIREQGVQNSYVEEMEDLSAGAYQRLLDFCQPTQSTSFFQLYFPLPTGFCRPPRLALSVDVVANAAPATIVDLLNQSSVTLAPHPFCLSDADLDIISCDRVVFKVSSHIVRLASPTLLSLVAEKALPPDSLDAHSVPDRRTITLPETSSVLSILMRTCYPLEDPTPSTFGEAYAALKAAKKYNMPKAIRTITSSLLTLSNDPLKLYFVACKYHLRDLALRSARSAIRGKLSRLSYPEMDSGGVSAGHLRRLLDYRERSRAAALNAVDPKQHVGSLWVLCNLRKSCSPYRESEPPCWLEPYLKKAGSMDWPRSESVTDAEFLTKALTSDSHSTSFRCGSCIGRPKDMAGVLKFVRRLARCLEEAEAKTMLEWRELPCVPEESNKMQ